MIQIIAILTEALSVSSRVYAGVQMAETASLLLHDNRPDTEPPSVMLAAKDSIKTASRIATHMGMIKTAQFFSNVKKVSNHDVLPSIMAVYQKYNDTHGDIVQAAEAGINPGIRAAKHRAVRLAIDGTIRTVIPALTKTWTPAYARLVFAAANHTLTKQAMSDIVTSLTAEYNNLLGSTKKGGAANSVGRAYLEASLGLNKPTTEQLHAAVWYDISSVAMATMNNAVNQVLPQVTIMNPNLY